MYVYIYVCIMDDGTIVTVVVFLLALVVELSTREIQSKVPAGRAVFGFALNWWICGRIKAKK